MSFNFCLLFQIYELKEEIKQLQEETFNFCLLFLLRLDDLDHIHTRKLSIFVYCFVVQPSILTPPHIQSFQFLFIVSGAVPNNGIVEADGDFQFLFIVSYPLVPSDNPLLITDDTFNFCLLFPGRLALHSQSSGVITFQFLFIVSTIFLSFFILLMYSSIFQFLFIVSRLIQRYTAFTPVIVIFQFLFIVSLGGDREAGLDR